MTVRLRNFAYAALSFVLLVSVVNNVIVSARELRRYYTNMWIWDPWDYLAHFPGYRSLDLSVFWIQHNEHREIGTELSYVADIFLFHGTQILPEALGILAYLVALIIFICCAYFSAKTFTTRWPVIAAALLATAVASYKLCVISLTIPFLTSWPQWECFAAASLVALVLHKKRIGKLPLIASILLAVAATYSMSNGMLLWPLLLIAGFLLNLSRRELGTIAISAGCSIGLYFFHYRNLHSLDLVTLVKNPVYFAMFLGSFLGMPFSTAFHLSNHIIQTSICGWIGLAIALFDAVWIVRKKMLASAPVIVMGGFCILVICSSLLTASGRMNPADPLMVASRAGRYLTEPTLFWCALFLLTAWLLGNVLNSYAALLFLLAASVASAKTLPLSATYYNWWNNYFQRGQWASIALANGVTDDSVADILYGSREYFAQFHHVLSDNRLGLFADPQPWWVGHRPHEFFSISESGDIHGDVTNVRKLGKDFEVQGWADGADTVVFVGADDKIIGFGIRPSAGPAKLYTHDVPEKLAFAGFIRGELGGQQFSAWAVDQTKHKISRIGALENKLP